MNDKTLYDFEGFRVDAERKCLWRGEDLVSLTPKAFDTLLVLLRNKGDVVSKDVILDEVWKDTFVEESTLAQNISTLRKTLAQYEAGKEFIVTIPRRGYRFVAEVTELNADEEILVVEKRSVTRIVAEREETDGEPATGTVAAAEVGKVSRPAGRFAGRGFLYGLAAAFVLVAVMLAVLFFAGRNEDLYTARFEKFRLGTLLSGADIESVSVSPDGRYIAVVERGGRGDAVSLRQIADGNAIEVLPETDLRIVGTAFSPGGDYIYYTAYRSGPTPRLQTGRLFKVPLLGGAPQEILADIDSPPAVSADNRSVAFVRQKPREKKTAVVVAGTDGSSEKELAVRDIHRGYSTAGLSWSPDGRLLSAVVTDRTDEKSPAKIVLLDAATGEEEPLTKQKWVWIGRTAWLGDGSGVAFVAYGEQSPNITDEIWFVSYPEGETKPVTNGINGIGGFGLTDDAGSVVATRQTRITSSFVAPLEDLDAAREVSRTADEVSLLHLGTDWTAADRLVYARTQNGNADIWSMKADGTDRRQLTADPAADYAPVVAPDGSGIYFLSARGGAVGIWRMDGDGSDPREIVRRPNLFPPSLPDSGDVLYFSARSADKPFHVLWRADPDGRNAVELTSVRTYAARVSPDGRYVFCYYPDAARDPDDVGHPPRFTVLSAADGKIVRQFGPLTSRTLPFVEWRRESDGFYILGEEEGRSVLLLQKLDGGEPEKVRTWRDGRVYQIALSDDGKRLFFEKGKEVDSVIRLEDVPAGG